MNKTEWYFEFAKTASLKSPDLERKVGCALVNKSSGAVIALGFNGFIRGAPDNLLPKSGDDKHENMIHAEMNLIFNCARHGISMENCVLYSTLSPCPTCTRALLQVGIDVVYAKEIHSSFEKVKVMDDVRVFAVSYQKHYQIRYEPNV